MLYSGYSTSSDWIGVPLIFSNIQDAHVPVFEELFHFMSVFLDIASLLDFLSLVIVKSTLICKKFPRARPPILQTPTLCSVLWTVSKPARAPTQRKAQPLLYSNSIWVGSTSKNTIIDAILSWSNLFVLPQANDTRASRTRPTLLRRTPYFSTLHHCYIYCYRRIPRTLVSHDL